MRVFLIAGEPSGDALGQALMAGLRSLVPDVVFEGVGGPLMCAEGMESLFPMEELSVMGLAEILPKYRHLKRRIRESARAVLDAGPDVLITIDSPDFCLRVARLVKEASTIRTVHYVAPTVWAWRPGRAQKMAGVIDHVLALFPFEPPLMQAAGMECDFVGHPVVSRPVASASEAAAFRADTGLGEAPLVLLLPGSREGEVARIAPVLGETAARMARARPDLAFVLPVAGAVADRVAGIVAEWPVRPRLIDPRSAGPLAKRAAFRAADVAIAASGTVSLELAAARTPMVIAYRMNPVTFAIMRRMALTDTVTLVNLVSETRTVPEFLGPACRADTIAPAALDLLQGAPDQVRAMDLTMDRLGRTGDPPGLRAARAVLARL
ncbi:lipid-A-disaccharide synthase [Pseudooceanicola batsensis HTCC2597]|uniref:Lipid-A-disaccharide synthase n=1 Tax=Pseudooceanicola batsensis (strain ATCC BAA-863 / DSM 15984 / KCTC 12145 / HTCC2597) TaxID=252305 RepID=A3TWV7_PSEBH|nr:lipid-A-disaccharide synthase [Pseudooceanicola batsensis]EAQ03317.1 lipid-A-disaccharide synthase [Pseudooceanicola batsensis HTCC2597]